MSNVVMNDKNSSSTPSKITASEAKTTEQIKQGLFEDINRIFEDTTIKKSIVLDEISLPIVNSEGQNSGSESKTIRGMDIPLIRINSLILPTRAIKYMKISNEGKIPSIMLTLSKDDDSITSNNMPMDGDIISVFCSSKTDTIKSLRMDFTISNVVVNKNTIVMTGNLFIPYYSVNTTYGLCGTTKETFIETAKRLGIGFATNDEDNTNDKQVWICNNKPYQSFLNDMSEHIWKDETSFFDWWIDPYYNLTLVNINKILIENSEKIDVTAIGNPMFTNSDSGYDTSQEDSQAGVKVFSNHPNMQANNFLFKSYDIHNSSSSISMNTGVEIKSSYFIHNQNMYNGQSECYKVLSNVPTYDQTKVDTHIILRGRAEYKRDQATEDDLPRANYNFKDIYITKPYCGISYTLSDEDAEENDVSNWSGNVHKNYIRAPYHNEINLSELNKMGITIHADGMNLQTMRGETIQVAMFKMDNNFTEDTTPVDKLYSGQYLVTGMSYEYNYGRGYQTNLTLRRREWPTPLETEKPKEDNQINAQ